MTEENEERNTIVNKYRRGRKDLLSKEIDEWEDPQFEIYHVTDRYGFIHENRLPEKLTVFENKIRVQENVRLTKWLKMLKSWEQYFPNSEKLRTRVYKGIPNAVRGEVWSRLLSISRVKQEQDGKYTEMLSYGLDHSPDVRQIDLDVNRTYRNHIMFRERYNTKQQMLFKVLVAYSVYNSEIGYCQGMSQIAALLLMYMDEEDAFWSLSVLMSDERHAMHGFFIPGFPKLLRFARHHDSITKKFLPKLAKLFKKYDIDSTLYTLKWFFQCFLDRVPFSLTLRLWDCFLLDGEVILTGMSYTLLKLHKRTLLRKGMEQLIEFLQIELEKDFGYHDDQAINALQQSIQELRRHSMLVPADGPTPSELPSRPFGLILSADHRNSLLNDDQSIVGSIILRPTDCVSLAQTSRTESEVGSVSDFDSNSMEPNNKLQRSISIYDNVDVNECIEAAKRLSAIEITDNTLYSRPKSRESKDSIDLNEDVKCSEMKTSIEKQTTHREDKESDREEKSPSSGNSTNLRIQTASNQINCIKNDKSIAKDISDKVIESIDKTNVKSNGNQFTYRLNSHLSDSERHSYSFATNSLESEFVQEWPDSTHKRPISALTILPIINDKTSDDKLKLESSSTQLYYNMEKMETNESYSHESTDISSVSFTESSSFKTVIKNEESLTQKMESNEESKSQNNKSGVINGEIGSRTSPLRTPWKKSSEKRQGMVMVSPTSPTSPPVKPSLIPRYIASNHSHSTSLNSSPFKSQTRYDSNMQMKSSYLKSNSTCEESTKLRIFVPFHYDDSIEPNRDSNKIQLRVDSPTLQLKQNDSKYLPAVDT